MKWLKDGVEELKGIGPKKASLLGKLGLRTLEDALFYFPRDYEVHGGIGSVNALKNGERASLRLMFQGRPKLVRRSKNLSILKWNAEDDTGRVECVWFNQPYRRSQYRVGVPYYVYGKVEKGYGKVQIQNPLVEGYRPDDHDNYRAYPIYPLVKGLTQRDLRNVTGQILKELPEDLPDVLPELLKNRYNLVDRYYALNNIHYPKDPKALEESKRRLKFEEFFLLQMGLYAFRNQDFENPGIPFDLDKRTLDGFIEGLSFRPTEAQYRVMDEVLKDLGHQKPMNRLVYGDVGSGKTLIAAMALYAAYLAGYQGTIMAPTEILATQHYRSLTELFKNRGLRISLLTGSLKDKEKESIKSSVALGHVDIVVATHAILQEDVIFNNLGIVVTDEQHRFGVRQRGILAGKGDKNPHVLVMSATPIPRTLALILYGDLDISVIDELPPGRKPVKTYHVPGTMKDRVYGFIKKQADLGFQSYLVCPLIDESQEQDISSVLQLYEELKAGPLKDIPIGLVHGRMSPQDKERVMKDFERGALGLLMATTVIEVGVNVPTANLMVIENAERFGLAQLHQLRGRVGRSHSQAYCILISDAKGKKAGDRMNTMVKTTNGFLIAQKDLELRGPGEFMGIKQHGLPEFRIGDLIEDRDILKEAQEAAGIISELRQDDPLRQNLLDYARGELHKKMEGISLN